MNTQKSAISRIENHAEDIKLSTLEKFTQAIGQRPFVFESLDRQCGICMNGISRMPRPGGCRWNWPGRVEFVPLEKEPEIVAGLDCAFSGDGKRTFAAAVVLRVVGLRSGQGQPERFEFEQVETVTAAAGDAVSLYPRTVVLSRGPCVSGGCGEAQADAGLVHDRRAGGRASAAVGTGFASWGCFLISLPSAVPRAG